MYPTVNVCAFYPPKTVQTVQKVWNASSIFKDAFSLVTGFIYWKTTRRFDWVSREREREEKMSRSIQKMENKIINYDVRAFSAISCRENKFLLLRSKRSKAAVNSDTFQLNFRHIEK